MGVKQFLPGKYYKHSSGASMHTIRKIQSDTWGKCLLSEDPSGEFSPTNPDVGVIEEGYLETHTVGWEEIGQEEWDRELLAV